MYYKISDTRLKGFADQARRLAEITGELTPEQIEDTLSGIEAGLTEEEAEAMVNEAIGKLKLQSKTVTPTDAEQTITADEGYFGLASVIVEELPNAEETNFGGDEVNAKYIINGETLTGIADQVQRICNLEENMTPEQMETNLLNVTVGAELPKAEEGAFGSAGGGEYGITALGSESQSTNSSTRTLGWKFTATEAFSIIGFRQKHSNENYKRMKLWDSAGNLVASITTWDSTTEWKSYYLDTPVNVAIGETYTVSVCTLYWTYAATSGTTFNDKLTDIQYVSAANDVYPTERAYSVFNIDIIIAPVQAELPDSYEIQHSTMDDIAEEVQRITGATNKLSTEQIITALQGIAAQTT